MKQVKSAQHRKTTHLEVTCVKVDTRSTTATVALFRLNIGEQHEHEPCEKEREIEKEKNRTQAL